MQQLANCSRKWQSGESSITCQHNVQLLRSSSCSCDDFVTFCDVRGNRSMGCCDTVFDPEPVFAFTGTCFKMKMPMYEKMPFVFSSVKVGLLLGNQFTPQFQMRYTRKARLSTIFHFSYSFPNRYNGLDALQRTGAFYVLTSGNDLAVSKLLVNPMRARGGTINSLALRGAVVSFCEISIILILINLLLSYRRTELN